jgi:hypothetical protein
MTATSSLTAADGVAALAMIVEPYAPFVMIPYRKVLQETQIRTETLFVTCTSLKRGSSPALARRFLPLPQSEKP